MPNRMVPVSLSVPDIEAEPKEVNGYGEGAPCSFEATDHNDWDTERTHQPVAVVILQSEGNEDGGQLYPPGRRHSSQRSEGCEHPSAIKSPVVKRGMELIGAKDQDNEG